jgi:hypothetical protein
MMIRTIAQAVALLIFGFIIYATLSTLDHRPRTGYVGLEREAAFFVFAFALTVGFPEHLWQVLIGVVVATLGLELAQHLTPDRHGQMVDALQKLAGGALGVGMGLVVNRFLVG